MLIVASEVLRRPTLYNAIAHQKITNLLENNQLKPGVGKLFTRRARFAKTVEVAGRTLIGKQGKDLFSFFWRSQSTYECGLQNKRLSPRFSFQFCTVEAYFFLKSLPFVIFKGKKGLPVNSWWEFKFL